MIARATLAAAGLLLAGCASTDLGGAGSLITGAADDAGGTTEASDQLARCAEPIGTVALVESQTWGGLYGYGLEDPEALIRLIMAQSGCFEVVERGRGLTRMQQERALADGGELESGAGMGGGQMLAADYYLTPNITFSDDDTGGYGGALGGLVGQLVPGTAGSLLGGLAGNVKFNEAESVLILTDTRTGGQRAIAQGSARSTDIGGGLGLGSLAGIGAIGGGYSDTPEGKTVAGAFLDAYNNLVARVREG